MDTVLGSKLQGSIHGEMMNGARLVEGQNGKALIMDGTSQYVKLPLGDGHDCLKNPDLCSRGVTVSMWLMDLGNRDRINIVISSKRCATAAIGFCYGIGQTYFFATVRGGSFTYRYRIPPLERDTWEHIVIRFHPNETPNINIYKNGCDTSSYTKDDYDPISALSPRQDNENTEFRFSDESYGANMKLDDFLVWYDMIHPDQIWTLYIQGGLVWSSQT